MQDEEGAVLRGRFNRPHAMMDLFEYQGTKAAELAGEDYAAQRRVHFSCLIDSTMWWTVTDGHHTTVVRLGYELAY